MIVGLGIDVVEISRIRDLHRRRSEGFCNKVFTSGELAACTGRRDPIPGLAARFAAKEAGMKALGTGWGEGVAWQDLEVVSGGDRPPRIELHRKAAARASALGAQRAHLSLSHDGGIAAAVVVLESAGGAEP
jgi:holo-[acyl-carrier protein] synthase